MLRWPAEEEVETGTYFQSQVSDPSSLASSGCVGAVHRLAPQSHACAFVCIRVRACVDVCLGVILPVGAWGDMDMWKCLGFRKGP